MKCASFPSLHLCILLSLIPSFSHAAVVAGDTLVIDFTKVGQETAGNWNNVSEADLGTNGWTGSTGIQGPVVLASDFIRFSDGAATGVGLSFAGLEAGVGSGTNSGIGGLSVAADDAAASFAVSGLIPTSAQQDVSFHVNGETQFILTGLDNALTYNLSIQSWTSTTARESMDWVVNPGLASESTQSVDPNTSPSVYTFSGLSTDGSGQIILRNTDAAFGGTNVGHINAMELTVIPEPTSLTFVTLALGALVLIRFRTS